MIIATDKPVKISTMTGKLEGLQAINTNTLSNDFCGAMRATDSICAKCYSAAMLSGSRKNCVPAFEHNSAVLSAPLTARQIPVINARYFRFHGHGELINRQHLENFYLIAEANPQTTFTLWTKRQALIRTARRRPDNMILIYSNPRLDRIIARPPKAFDKVFNNVPKDYKGEANCTGQKCMECLACYTHGGTDVIVEHAKVRH
jgi:hypothetical protein